MKKTLPKKENKRKLILKTARKVFAKNGYFRTTIDMVANDCNLAKGTIYLYFKNKEDLFFSLVEEGYNELLNYVRKIKEEPVDPLKKIYNLIKLDVEFHEKNNDLCRLFLDNQSQTIDTCLPKFREKIISKHMEQVKLTAEIVSEGISQGKIKKVDPYQMAVIIAGIIHTLNFIKVLNFHRQKTTSDKEIDFIYDFILNGCRKEITNHQ